LIQLTQLQNITYLNRATAKNTIFSKREAVDRIVSLSGHNHTHRSDYQKQNTLADVRWTHR